MSVYHAEQTHSYNELTDLTMELVEDAQAPAGVRKVYTGILDPERSPESCLCFNIAHHSIHVYFYGVLQYSLTGAESNRIGRNVSSNWCSVHVGTQHAGQTVTIVLTPLLEAAVSKNTTFYLGSLFLVSPSLVLYLSHLFVARKRKALWVLACGSSAVCLGILMLQLLGLGELRQNLTVSHVLLILSMVSLPWRNTIWNARSCPSTMPWVPSCPGIIPRPMPRRCSGWQMKPCTATSSSGIPKKPNNIQDAGCREAPEGIL